jgi:hypothetical protein
LDRTSALSYAQTEFVSTGTMQTYQESIKHTRKYVIDTAIVTTTEPEYDNRDDGDRDNDNNTGYSTTGAPTTSPRPVPRPESSAARAPAKSWSVSRERRSGEVGYGPQ